MKSLILVISLIIQNTLFSQNITNTLGTSGTFRIKDNTSTYFSLNQSNGMVEIGWNMRLTEVQGSQLGILYKGTSRFLHSYSPAGTLGRNIFLGIDAGNFTMSQNSADDASYNIGIGVRALNSLTIGKHNVAIGFESLTLNTSGNENIAIGHLSMQLASFCYGNIGIGYTALFSNSGYYNTAVGRLSMRSNDLGNWNTALGYGSLYSNVGADWNVAIGSNALYYNRNQFSNNGESERNAAVGSYALYNNTFGSYNTAMGYSSLFDNLTGNNNTAMGYGSLTSSTGSNNTSIGRLSGSTLESGSNNTLLGHNSQPSTTTVSNQITLGNSSVTSLRCNVTSISSLSDVRDKKNVSDLSLGLDFISKLKPRQFNWDKREWYEDNTSDGSKMQETPTAGFIAQELDDVQITANAEWLILVLKDNPEKWEATAGNLLPVMVKAIQELKIENDKLKEEIESLKIDEGRLVRLEQIISELNQTKEVKSAEK